MSLKTTHKNWIISSLPHSPVSFYVSVYDPRATCSRQKEKASPPAISKAVRMCHNVQIGMRMWLRVSVGGLDVVKVIQGDLA